MTQSWHRLSSVDDFPQAGMLSAEVGAWRVLAVRLEDGFAAWNDCCTHQASRLSTGRVRRGAILCPLHGARFDLTTGQCIGGTYPPLRAFPLRIENGEIEVAIPDAAPGAGESAVVG